MRTVKENQIGGKREIACISMYSWQFSFKAFNYYFKRKISLEMFAAQ